jgi:3-phosphoshikimate 1-carboxyvinyltransferase
MKVSPINIVRGEIRVPGDKSVSHRAAIMAALSEGRSVIKGFSSAADCQSTLDCVSALGVKVSVDNSTIYVESKGIEGFKKPEKILNANNSGTTIRLLSGVLAGLPFESIITGDESLRKRPMRRIAEPLKQMGAIVETQENGCAPVRIHGMRPLKAITYTLPVASAQIKSAVLLAGLSAEGETTVVQPVATRDHTERIFRGFGIPLNEDGEKLIVRGVGKLQARDLLVPGDVSSAAFYMAAAVMLPGSDVTITDLGLNPTRTGFIQVIEKMGAEISITDKRDECGEPVGTVRIKGRPRGAGGSFAIGGDLIPNVIDELPLLAFLAASTNWELEVRDAAELRVKESDRIASTVDNLRRMGANIEEHEDGWRVLKGNRLRGATLESYGDHRIAMASAIAALTAEGESEIEGADEAVSVSLPEFWKILEQIRE